jgi:hypothetical protein
VRRTLALLALAALGLGLLVLVRAPARVPRPDRVHGARVLRVRRAAVRAIELSVRDRRLGARRTPGGWDVDGRPASAGLAAALDDLVASLAALRAVDAFRPRDRATYGLEPGRGTIVVTTRTRVVRLVLGHMNAAGSAVYARRSGDPRVFQLGAGLLGTLDGVFYRRDVSRRGGDPVPP